MVHVLNNGCWSYWVVITRERMHVCIGHSMSLDTQYVTRCEGQKQQESHKSVTDNRLKNMRREEEYLYSAFWHQGTYKALRHGSHSFTCKQHHACLSFVAFTRCHHHSNWGSKHPIAAHYYSWRPSSPQNGHRPQFLAHVCSGQTSPISSTVEHLFNCTLITF